MRLPAALSLVTLALASCGNEPIEVLEGSGNDHLSPKIYGGSAPDAPHHDAVVSLHQLTRSGSVYVLPFCTGTLIAEDVVLTAAHCLDTARGGTSFKTMEPTQLAVYVGDDPRVDIVDHLYAVSATEIYSGYDRRNLTGDIALLQLSTAPSESVSPVDPLPSSLGFTASDASDPALNLNFVGYGEIEDGSWGGKLQADAPLAGLGCALPSCWDSGDAATQISYSQTDGAGPCSGDSGGPAFIQRSGTWYVGGITSYGDSYCEYYGVSTRVDAYGTFIDDFIAGGGGSGSGGDGGATGDGGADTCGDGVCDDGESCDGRDGTTECSADCDGVTKGKPTERYCWVGSTCEGAGCP